MSSVLVYVSCFGRCEEGVYFSSQAHPSWSFPLANSSSMRKLQRSQASSIIEHVHSSHSFHWGLQRHFAVIWGHSRGSARQVFCSRAACVLGNNRWCSCQLRPVFSYWLARDTYSHSTDGFVQAILPYIPVHMYTPQAVNISAYRKCENMHTSSSIVSSNRMFLNGTD